MTTKTDIALLRCPFCGGEAEMDTRQGYLALGTGRMGNRIAVYCRSCDADMGVCIEDVPDITPEQVAEMWNRRAAVEADRQRRGEPVVWKPIETAPKDNKRLLYLARLDDQGKLVELDFDGVWEYWQESWELSHINGYCWMSANGIEEPTHWAYQDDPPPTTPQPAEPCVAPTLHNADSGAQNGIQATQPAEPVADIHHWEWKHPVFTKGIWEKCCSLQMGIARAEYRKIAPQPAESVKVPSDEELLKWAGEEQFFLFCDEDEFLQIAREVLSRYGRPAEISTTTVENTVDNCAAKEE